MRLGSGIGNDLRSCHRQHEAIGLLVFTLQVTLAACMVCAMAILARRSASPPGGLRSAVSRTPDPTDRRRAWRGHRAVGGNGGCDTALLGVQELERQCVSIVLPKYARRSKLR